MAIYTKTGDDGDTALFGGGRVPKNDRRVEAYGAVDELNSFVGLALTSLTDVDADPDADGGPDADADPGIRRGLLLIQNDLFALGANLATPERDDSRPRPRTPDVPVARVEAMEGWIDRATEELPELREFILPGGTGAAAMLHVCRSVCRRAEREVVALGREETLDPGIVRYLNRLSDLFFVWARLENLRAGQADVPWSQE
ncbi:MAG: cob(I)yrinic acid a,c-diamide adenosyltransferase [Gemmatimonadetes bacterium]|jgi:cob(I)alamin adenosyltransferase|nr:cob(I)yrinic acid a,c-diamide adenosyltransferase [Gemmatimonadota bacterium]